jgi:curved DNA-binding protein CbpA
MVDINLSYKILSNPISRKKYDQALNESLGRPAQTHHASAPSAKRPQYHPSSKRQSADYKNPGHAFSQDGAFQNTETPEHEYAKLINRIKANAVDEIELVNLFEKLFKMPLTIRHGYSNTYLFEENEKRYTHDFRSLKDVIVQKLSFELSKSQGDGGV